MAIINHTVLLQCLMAAFYKADQNDDVFDDNEGSDHRYFNDVVSFDNDTK